ncbi:hypothetical protein Glove_227g182 [Diversispora epigaea]|uniref:ZSWIM1/3 RNaseH-like domain-containing protein n=1 Tax=Diversispora epigaea TaxID=1348612 RepID=A0A397IM56_9GLOM|nr:hypothetical protein Glove_227g182 [Diversispora epigaea]
MEIESSEAIMSNLTPDEKRNLLFDVTCSLEIPMKDFDENWWPLVSNIWTQWNSITKTRPSNLCCAKIRVLWQFSLKMVKVDRCKDSPNHTHTLLESDQIKRSQAIRTLVEKDAIKNYSAPAITAAVKEYATKTGLGTSVSELKCKEVANIKYKVRGPMESHLICNSNLNSDILKSITFLTEKGYHVKNYCVSHQFTKGIVFAHPKQLEKLQRHGWLTLIDSTHKTNKYDWRLFTLYVRDTYGCWDVGAHFLVSSEDGDTVFEALKIVRSYCNWIPRYMLSDQSSIEAKGIRKAFPGISAGEQECEVILCVVHVMRIWMTKIYDKKTRNIMNAAMHKRTKIGCEKLIQEAINNCTVPVIRNYIKRNYVKNMQQWALWARQHSPLLLQVTTTNPLESYHSELKRLTSSSHGLIGAVHNIVDIDCKKRTDSERAAFDFRIKKVSAYGVDNDIIGEIHKFPFPIQHLLVKEACAVMDRIEKGKGFQEMFEESGYEIYEGRESVVEFAQTGPQKEAEDRRLTVVELTERVRDKYWSVEEMGDVKKTEAFISMLETSLNPIISKIDK